MPRHEATRGPALPPWLLLLLAAAAGATIAACAAEDSPTPASASGATDDDPPLEALLLRDSRARDNFLRFGRAGRDNFLRFGKSGRDNFLRFGRAGRDNFLRFGKSGRDNFLRFGRAGRDNFLRFGKSYRDNFLRFGRAPRDNFLRFGRGEELDEFAREARDRSQNNFVRLGRAGDGPDDVSLEEEAVGARVVGADAGEPSPFQRELRLAPDRNFLRFGRARPDNFLRLGRNPAAPPVAADGDEADGVTGDGEEAPDGGEASEGSPNEVSPSDGTREGSAGGEEEPLQRQGRAARPRNLFGRWKMSDLNFIRLGRSAAGETLEPAEGDAAAAATEAVGAGSVRTPVKRSAGAPRSPRANVGRSDGYVDNFIRLGNGKREARAAAAGKPRAKRALGPGGDAAARSGSDCSSKHVTVTPSVFGELPLSPLSYYSPLAVGLPNYLFTPELTMLPSGERAASKRSDNRPNSNFIRLG